ncbi:MAG: FecR family protein [Bacteriovoracaceae bacterium]
MKLIEKLMIFSLLFMLPNFQGITSSGTEDGSIGRITKARGQIYKTNFTNGSERVPLKGGDKIYVGDIVESDSRSFAKILMHDDSVFSVGPQSKFSFEKFQMKNKNERTATYNLIKGKLRSVFTRKAPGKTLKIKTPTASMGIRGTEIVSDVYKVKGRLKTDIALLHGKLEVTTTRGKKFDLKPSEMFEATREPIKVSRDQRKPDRNVRKIAQNRVQAKKRVLKKKVFEVLKKSPRKGGQTFLFDALKSERKDLTKEVEFHDISKPENRPKREDVSDKLGQKDLKLNKDLTRQELKKGFSGGKIKSRAPASEKEPTNNFDREAPKFNARPVLERKPQQNKELAPAPQIKEFKRDGIKGPGPKMKIKAPQMKKPPMPPRIDIKTEAKIEIKRPDLQNKLRQNIMKQIQKQVATQPKPGVVPTTGTAPSAAKEKIQESIQRAIATEIQEKQQILEQEKILEQKRLIEQQQMIIEQKDVTGVGGAPVEVAPPAK